MKSDQDRLDCCRRSCSLTTFHNQELSIRTIMESFP